MGLRRDTVSKLKEAVIANGFQVASITVDIAGVVDHAVDGNDSLADSCQLIQGQSSLTMVTHAEGGPTGLGHFHLTNGGMDAATLERELRITLGQFPQSFTAPVDHGFARQNFQGSVQSSTFRFLNTDPSLVLKRGKWC